MRVDLFRPLRPSQDPTRSGSVHESFSGEEYDIFLVEGSTFVCRGAYVAVYGPQGAAFIGPELGRDVVAGFNKRWPRKQSKVESPSKG